MLATEIIARYKKPNAPYTPDFFEFEDGTFVWNASLVLQHYVCQKYGALKGKRVLELGSGLGHAAFGLARMGAHVTCTEHPKCMKDLRASLDKQLASCSAEGKPFLGSIEAVELEWGEEGFTRSKLAQQDVPPFDAIILAELVYNTLYHDVLLWTLGRFSRPETLILSVLIDRPFSFAFFSALAATERYDVEPITEFDALGMDTDLLAMHRLIARPQQDSS